MPRRCLDTRPFGVSAKPPHFQEQIAGSIPARGFSPNVSRSLVTSAIRFLPCVKAVGSDPEESSPAGARANIDFRVKGNRPPYRLLGGYEIVCPFTR